MGEFMYASAFTPHFKNILSSRSYRDVLSPKTFNLNYIDDLVENYLNGKEASGVELSDLGSISVHTLMGWGKMHPDY